MKCLHPIRINVSIRNPQGNLVPCGKCIGCRVRRREEWTIRCIHEAQKYKDSCFITLTYNNDNLPKTLILEDLQKFLKRFRKKISPLKIRYFACGEYGEKSGRPHYHLLVFNWSPKKEDSYKINKHLCSSIIGGCWKFGNHDIGNITVNSCSYVAGYIEKKIISRKEKYHEDGRLSEFCVMSRRPGLGDISKVNFNEYFHLKNRKVGLPRFYRKKLGLVGDLNKMSENLEKINYTAYQYNMQKLMELRKYDKGGKI